MREIENYYNIKHINSIQFNQVTKKVFQVLFMNVSAVDGFSLSIVDDFLLSSFDGCSSSLTTVKSIWTDQRMQGIYLRYRFAEGRSFAGADIHAGSLRGLTAWRKLIRKKKLVGNKPIWSPFFYSCSISLVNELVFPLDGRWKTVVIWVGLIYSQILELVRRDVERFSSHYTIEKLL